MTVNKQVIIDGQVYIVSEEVEKEEQYTDVEIKELIKGAIREKFSIEDEIAIIRQKETKPDEFISYYNEVEKIKKQIKERKNK